ncbi:ferrichrome transport ATP-binding protein FhuC [Treponema primitia ZAS-2]|uniref:Ferrichrome transport ATP-binding protein FhuC n=1 Tax=Treponema primitia (strain ATCC BAA-887 / DSM 12427 / ZAS-2) TaxID=545694 RepID=F5YKV0_TREPZ|nr:ABC transporter ATP-binding protein [Treponema primitia]AEF83873.1 ferrichrome transport ATP-binding protein FhuC [Treponema primitia ZAS-2]
MIDIKNLYYHYKKTKPILQNFNFRLDAGDRLAILGNNGVGKSTLLKCLTRIILPQKGEMTFEGQDLLKTNRVSLAKCLAFVAQDSPAVHITVYDMIMLGRKPYIKWGIQDEDTATVCDVIRRLDLENLVTCFVDELSGGERQKVMLARALAQQPRILLLDEPTSNLDMRNQYEVLSLIKEISIEHKIAVIMVIHDINLALRFCNKFLLIKDSKIFDTGGEEILSGEKIEAVYGIPVSVIELEKIRFVVPVQKHDQ